MKEIFSAFGSEVFRPLATILVPGALAISSWFVVLVLRFQALQKLIAENHTETAIILALACISAGLLLEDIGARVESKIFDPLLKKKTGFAGHSEEWNRYLRLAFKTEPVGQRYLRSIMLRFKFETGAGFALLLAGVGFSTPESRSQPPFWGFWDAVGLQLICCMRLDVRINCSARRGGRF